MTMGDRIVVMLDGEVQQIATPSELYKKPLNRFVAGFIGTPPMNFLDGSILEENGLLYFVAGERVVKLAVNPVRSPGIGRYSGKSITLGIRPEAILENVAQRDEPGQSVEATVTLVEPLGAETLVHLDVAGSPVISRMPGDADPRVQSTLLVDVDMSRAHFFDAVSEAAITRV
jgi:multiple sugar transport system ATP-binding protein